MNLHSELIRLARENPELRVHLVPLLRTYAEKPRRSQIVPFPSVVGLDMNNPEVFIKELAKRFGGKGEIQKVDVGDTKQSVMHKYWIHLPRVPGAKNGRPMDLSAAVFIRGTTGEVSDGNSRPLAIPVLEYILKDFQFKYATYY